MKFIINGEALKFHDCMFNRIRKFLKMKNFMAYQLVRIHEGPVTKFTFRLCIQGSGTTTRSKILRQHLGIAGTLHTVSVQVILPRHTICTVLTFERTVDIMPSFCVSSHVV